MCMRACAETSKKSGQAHVPHPCQNRKSCQSFFYITLKYNTPQLVARGLLQPNNQADLKTFAVENVRNRICGFQWICREQHSIQLIEKFCCIWRGLYLKNLRENPLDPLGMVVYAIKSSKLLRRHSHQKYTKERNEQQDERKKNRRNKWMENWNRHWYIQKCCVQKVQLRHHARRVFACDDVLCISTMMLLLHTRIFFVCFEKATRIFFKLNLHKMKWFSMFQLIHEWITTGFFLRSHNTCTILTVALLKTIFVHFYHSLISRNQMPLLQIS